MVSVGDRDYAVFHSLVIAEFLLAAKLTITTLNLGENWCIVGCNNVNSGLGSICRSHMSNIIEKALFQKDHMDLHDHKIWYNVPSSPQFLQHKAVW